MFTQYIITDFKMRYEKKIWDESVGIGSVPLFVIRHIHFPHNLCQDQGSEFDHIYSSGQLLFNYFFFCCLTKILHFSRILFLPQMCYHTLLNYKLNGFDKLS